MLRRYRKLKPKERFIHLSWLKIIVLTTGEVYAECIILYNNYEALKLENIVKVSATLIDNLDRVPDSLNMPTPSIMIVWPKSTTSIFFNGALI